MKEDIQKLEEASKKFIETATNVQLSKHVYENGWNAKNIIAHIVFYHEYYSNVITAKVQKKDLPLIDESLYKVNLRSSIEYSKFSRQVLVSRFEKAQLDLSKNLLRIKGTTLIPYKKGGRVYMAKDYVQEITRHLYKHIKDLQTKKRA